MVLVTTAVQLNQYPALSVSACGAVTSSAVLTGDHKEGRGVRCPARQPEARQRRRRRQRRRGRLPPDRDRGPQEGARGGGGRRQGRSCSLWLRLAITNNLLHFARGLGCLHW